MKQLISFNLFYYYKYLYLLSLSIIYSCSTVTSNGQVVENLNVKEFNQLLENQENSILIDVRTLEETNQGHIKDATKIDFYLDNFIEKINMVRKDVPVFVYCRSGGRSSSAARKMENLGFTKVYNLIGGISAWERENYNLVNTSDTEDYNIKTISKKDFEELLNTKLPVLVNFHTKWCVPCKKLSPIIDQLEKEKKGKIKIIRVDIDTSKEISGEYKITSVPTLVLYKQKKEIWRHIGFINKEQLLQKINE